MSAPRAVAADNVKRIPVRKSRLGDRISLHPFESDIRARGYIVSRELVYG